MHVFLVRIYTQCHNLIGNQETVSQWQLTAYQIVYSHYQTLLFGYTTASCILLYYIIDKLHFLQLEIHSLQFNLLTRCCIRSIVKRRCVCNHVSNALRRTLSGYSGPSARYKDIHLHVLTWQTDTHILNIL
jgi:hypothetical protein